MRRTIINCFHSTVYYKIVLLSLSFNNLLLTSVINNASVILYEFKFPINICDYGSWDIMIVVSHISISVYFSRHIEHNENGGLLISYL